MKNITEDQKGVNILSLDAGSPGGVLSQMQILNEFMHRLERSLGLEEDLLPADYFDLIGGSGIGGFAALCIGPLRMSGVEVIEALQLLGVSVFYEAQGDSKKTIFDSNDLKEAVKGIIERSGHSPDAMIGTIDPKAKSKTVFFVSPVVDIASCHRLRSYRARRGTLQCTILDVALACISTLGLFDYAEISPRRHKYTSVGFHYTNPIRAVLDEAEQIFGAEKRVACILSLGSGVHSQTTMPSNLAHLEVHALLQAMEMQQKVVTAEVDRQYGSLEAYFRFSVKGIGSGTLSDWVNWDADKVEACVQDYLEDQTYSKELDAAVGQVENCLGTITLNRLNHSASAAVIAKSVPPVTQFFVLRKKSWSFIEKNLAGAPLDRRTIFVLSGMGGCGKSTLLSYYVQVYGSRYSHIFLIDSTSIHTIRADLQNAIRSLGPEHSQKTWEEALSYFSEDRPDKNWLIAFDNADDPSIPLQDYIPDSENGTIFITTRNRDLLFLTSVKLHWELGSMTEDEALDALLLSAQRSQKAAEHDLEDGRTLAERLGRLALALIQAGTYCFQKTKTIDGIEVPFTFREYLHELDQNHAELLRYPAAQSLDQYGKSIYAALNMSYSALPTQTRDFLHFCGFFHHLGIPLSMLELAVENRFRQWPNLLPAYRDTKTEGKLAALLEVPGKSTTIHLHRIIFSLKMFSLVVTSMSPGTVMLDYHTLVSSWSRDMLSTSDRKSYLKMAIRVVSTCTARDNYHMHVRLIPHIQAIVRRPEDLHLNDMAHFAERLTSGGVPSEGEALYRRMYEKCVKEVGKDHERALTVLQNLSISVKGQGRILEAEKMEHEVLEGKKKIYPDDNERVFTTEYNLTTSYLHQRRYTEADPILHRLLEARKRRYGMEHPDTLLVLNNLAVSYSQQGRHREAAEMLEDLVKFRSSILGKDHPETLQAMVNLGNSYSMVGRLDEAMELQSNVLEIMVRTNGKEHPDVISAMNNVATLLAGTGKLDQAAPIAEQALDSIKRVLGRNHPDTFQTTSLVIKIYFEMGRLPEGVQLLEELRELEGPNGKWTKSVLESMN